MRKITKQSVDAFLSGQKFNGSNTAVTIRRPIEGVRETIRLELHGNVIATRIQDSPLFVINACGWFTTTTKERLNALPNVSIKQKAGVWYLNGEAWDGRNKTIEIYN
jgi:hypothetical protein